MSLTPILQYSAHEQRSDVECSVAHHVHWRRRATQIKRYESKRKSAQWTHTFVEATRLLIRLMIDWTALLIILTFFAITVGIPTIIICYLLNEIITIIMSPQLLFKACNVIVIPAWFLLAVAPGDEITESYCSFAVVAVALCYVFCLIFSEPTEGASFSTLTGVRNLFKRGDDYVVNACWIHYLAFDLVVGQLFTNDLKDDLPHLIRISCLFATMKFGPAGYLAFALMKVFRKEF